LERILYKSLAKDPDNRYQDMTEFGKALQGVLSEYGQRPEPKPWINASVPVAAEVKKAEEPKPIFKEQKTTLPKPVNVSKPIEKKILSEEKRKIKLPVVPLIAVFFVLAAIGGWYGVNQGMNGNAKNTPTLVGFGGLPNGTKDVTATPSPVSTEFNAGIAFLVETSTETATSTMAFTSTFRPTATKTSRPTATYTPRPPSNTSTKTKTSTPSKTFTTTLTSTISPTFTPKWPVTIIPTPTPFITREPTPTAP
jgi:hypothetical protein